MPESYKNLKIDIKGVEGYYSQKTPVDYELKAKNGNISVKASGSLGIAESYNWEQDITYYKSTEDKITALEEYKKMLKADGGNILEILKKKGKDFKVVTKLEYVEGENIRTVYENEALNELDEDIEIKDKKMKKGGKYILTKQLLYYVSGAGWKDGIDIVKEVDAEVDSNYIPDSISNMTNKELKYKLPVKLIKYGTDGDDSMGAKALNTDAEIIETKGGVKVILGFHEIYLQEFDMKGHLLKLGVYDSTDEITTNQYGFTNVEEKYQVDGKEYPKKLSFTRPNRGEKQIGVRVWVDAMEEIGKKVGKSDNSQPAILEIDWSKAPKNTLINSGENN